MPAKLLYRDAQGRDASVEIPDNAPLFLGRGMDCAIRTDDAMVSRKNCKVSSAGGRYFAEDLGSSNGTFVNEKKVQRQQLVHADVIRCGTLQVRYVEVAASAQPAAEARPRTQEVDVSALQEAKAVASAEQEAQLAQVNEELAASQKRLEEATSEIESLRAKVDALESEAKSLRTDAITMREDFKKVRREAAQDKEELVAVNRLAEELRAEVTQIREDNANLKTKIEEQTDDLATRDRQLERAQEDVQRTKSSTEELRAKLGELQKTKDEGWRELNSQLSQVEHLREVISEHERMLEERRVGLISLESATKDLRADKEKHLRENVDLKNQRDQLRDQLNRAEAKVEGLEEEHRRLARAMNEGAGAQSDETGRLAQELRDLKVEFRKLEGEKARATELLERADADRQKLSDDKARLDVERAQILEDKKAAEAARARAEEARARAESLKQRVEEEKQAAASARDAALASADDLRRNFDRAERRIVELEKAASASAVAAAPSEADPAAAKKLEAARDEALVARTRAETRARDLEAEITKVRVDAEAQLAELRALMEEKLSVAAAAGGGGNTLAGNLDVDAPLGATHGDTTSTTAVAAAGSDEAVTAIRGRAQEVYEGINEALSALRTAIITAKGLFGEVGPMVSDEDARRALGDALIDSMERTEDAKGLLRSLRELAQG